MKNEIIRPQPKFGIGEKVKIEGSDKEWIVETIGMSKAHIWYTFENGSGWTTESKVQSIDKAESIFSNLKMRDSQEAFENAIRNGLKNHEDYMYMYSDNGKDYFKHCITRQYSEFKISKESMKRSPVQGG